MVKAFYESAAIVDRSTRGKLLFTGEQNLWFLDQLLTNKLDELESGAGAEALLLTPKGKITDHFRIFRLEKAVYGDVAEGRAEPLKAFLDERVFMTRVEISDVSQEFALLELIGPLAEEVLSSARSKDGVLSVNLERPLPGVALWLPRERSADVVRALTDAGATAAGQQEYEDVRILEGSPTLDDYGGFLPQEAALESLVHFSKGCYLGQEAVAMAQRGSVKKKLRHLYFDGPALLGSIFFEDEEVGTVTSAASQLGLDRGIGMVKTSVPIDSKVSVAADEADMIDAVVKALPGTTEGPKLPSARELRERLQGGAN